MKTRIFAGAMLIIILVPLIYTFYLAFNTTEEFEPLIWTDQIKALFCAGYLLGWTVVGLLIEFGQWLDKQ